jgi:hypothetical protein
MEPRAGDSRFTAVALTLPNCLDVITRKTKILRKLQGARHGTLAGLSTRDDGRVDSGPDRTGHTTARNLKRRALITLGGDRVARRPYRFRRNPTSAIDEYTKKTIQATSSTNMTPIIIRGHTRWNRRSRGIAAGLPVAVAPTLGSEVVGPRLGSGG